MVCAVSQRGGVGVAAPDVARGAAARPRASRRPHGRHGARQQVHGGGDVPLGELAQVPLVVARHLGEEGRPLPQGVEGHQRAGGQVERQLHGRVLAVLGAAPDADEQVHGQHGNLVEQEEHEQVLCHEDPEHAGDQHQKEHEELLDASLQRPARPHARVDDHAGEQQQRHAPAIDAATAAALHLHQQQTVGLVQQQIDLTPAAAPLVRQQAPARGAQQAGGALFGPVAAPLGCTDRHRPEPLPPVRSVPRPRCQLLLRTSR